MSKVYINDLPVAAIRKVEKATGARADNWLKPVSEGGVSSIADLYTELYAAGNPTVPRDQVEAMTLAQLTDQVGLADKGDGEEEDPT